MPYDDKTLEFAQALATVDSRSRSNTSRLDKLEGLVSSVNELATSMRLMLQSQEQTADTVSRLDAKISAIESKPAKRWESVVEKILLMVVAAVVGLVFARVGIA